MAAASKNDLTAAEWLAMDPEAFEAALYLMNLKADDEKGAKDAHAEAGEPLVILSQDLRAACP